jgi:zinc protease
VVVSGDFDSEDNVFDRVNATLGAVPNLAPMQQILQQTAPEQARSRSEVWMHRKVDFDVPFLVMGYPAPPSSSDDALALEIVQSILSQGETSRMHRDIVRKRSLAVMASGMNQCLSLAGMSMFFAVFTPNVPVRTVEKAMLRQIDRIKSDGVTAEELEKTKNVSLTGRIFDLYSAEQICHRLGYAQTVEGNYQLWIQRLDTLEKMTSDKLVDVARTYWDDSKRLSLYLQPQKIKIMPFVAGLFLRFLNKR